MILQKKTIRNQFQFIAKAITCKAVYNHIHNPFGNHIVHVRWTITYLVHTLLSETKSWKDFEF